MPRKIVQVDPLVPYQVTARCLNREWFRIPMPDVWDLMIDGLAFTTRAFELEVYSFVLMSNHFHLLVRSPHGNLSEAMHWFMTQSSREITRIAGRINQTYGGRHKKTRIGHPHYFLNSYKYVYQNPVRAGLCDKVEKYRYSTLHGLLGQSPLYLPMVEDTILFSNVEETLKWLNTPISDEDCADMRKAFRHSDFRLRPRQAGHRRPNPLEVRLI